MTTKQLIARKLCACLTQLIDEGSTDTVLIDKMKSLMLEVMLKPDYDAFMREMALLELTRENERLGLYD